MAAVQSKITAKGQTTVPREVREALGVDAGDRLVYEIREGEAVIRRQPDVDAVFGSLKGHTKRPVADAATERRAARQAQVKRSTGRSGEKP